MRSLPRVYKPGSFGQSEEAVLIPDIELPPQFDPTGAPEARGVQRDEVSEGLLRRARQQADDLSAQIMARTNAECAKIREQALAEAEQIKEDARKEGVAIREQAKQAGHQDGIVEKAEEIAGCMGEVLTCLDQLLEEHQRYEERYEKEIASFAIDIAEKVLLDEINRDSLCLRNLARQAVRGIRNVDWISVEVSSALPDLVAKLETELAKVGRREEGEPRVEVTGADLPPGGCIIQTPEGIVDASLATQLRNLREMFLESDRKEAAEAEGKGEQEWR